MENEITKQKNEKISVNITGEMTVDELTDKLYDLLYANTENNVDVAFFVALLESKFQDWEVAMELMKHFDYLKKVYKEEVDPEWERHPLQLNSPKDILCSEIEG